VPRPTAIATALSSIIETGELRHPVLAVDGWWQREHRVGGCGVGARATSRAPARPVLVIGGGRLGTGFLRHCHARGLAVRGLDRATLDAADITRVSAAVARLQPWAIVNATGGGDVDAADASPAACWRDNVDVVRVLCQVAAAARIPLLTFSSDLVFEGGAARAYVEDDTPVPRSVFASSKVAAEAIAAGSSARVLVVRSGRLFDPSDTADRRVRPRQASDGHAGWQIGDAWTGSPTYLPHLVDAALDLLIDGEHGVWHLVNAASQAIASTFGVGPLRHRVLTSVRGLIMPSMDEALRQYETDRADMEAASAVNLSPAR
jgi:dTDP-4-dehydrorhamnose reductase